MIQPFTNQQLEHLLRFLGYGTLDAEYWFLGMEEAGGGEANLRTRLEFAEVEDCAHAHQLLGVTELHYGKKKIQRTWRGMCVTMLCLQGQEPSRENIRQYQAEQLGRASGNTLLLELMPIPKPKLNQWGYESLLPQFDSSSDYYQSVKPQRIELLQRLTQSHSPKAIISYGKGFWPEYKAVFGSASFQKNGQFEFAYCNSTLVVLCDHFTAITMNGKCAELAKLIESQSYGC